MAGFVIKVEGLQETLKRLNVKNFEAPIQTAFDNFGLNVQREAKQRAPVDEGLLKNSIFADKAFLSAIVGCSVNYAAYLEFGTRRFAAAYVSTLPATWQQLAAQSKGKGGGTFEEMVLRITEWVRREGIGAELTKSGNASKSKSSLNAQRQTAYLIARSILIKGIQPHPYLYPAVNMATPQLIKELKAIQV